MTNTGTDATEEAAQGFEYLYDYKILVCREHGFGLRNLRRHLLEQHAYSRHARDVIVERFGGLNIVNPEDAPLPTSAVEPFACLRAPRPALRCAGWAGQACEFVSTSKERLARHCNEHGWRSDVGDREHWFEVTVQSFCPASKSPRWFIVKGNHEDDTDGEEDNSTMPVSQIHRQTILQDFRTLDDRYRQDQEVVDAPMETDQTGWWKKTGWIEHLQGSNKRHLAHAARLPSKDEPVLQQVGALVEALVENCVAGLSTLPQELRRWLKSVKMSETDPRPMGRLQNKDSQKRYAGYAKRLICYSLRVLESIDAVDIADPQNESGDDWINVDAMDTTTEEGQGESPAGGPPDTMADARRLFKWKEGQKEKARAVLRSIKGEDEEAIQLATLLAFIETFVFSKVYHEPFDCPTVHFLAVLGIDEENDRLRTGNDYSYRVAGLIYCFRVFALEAVLPAEKRSAQGPDEFEAFLEQRKQYLTDGSMSVMSTMISLLAYGKYLAMNHGNAGAIFWEKEDKVMQLHGMRIVMDKFKGMVNRSITDAEDLLWERLLWTEGANRFEMNINALEDDMSFRKRGSYFVTNRQNRLMSSWEDKTVTWMLASRRGSKLRQEDGSWHIRRVKEYLREVDKFRELLLFCMHVTGGQPARGPEIQSGAASVSMTCAALLFPVAGAFLSICMTAWSIPSARRSASACNASIMVLTSCVSSTFISLMLSLISLRILWAWSIEAAAGIGAAEACSILAIVSSNNLTSAFSWILISASWSTFRFFGLAGHLVAFCHSSQSCGLMRLKLGVDSWYCARLPIGSEVFSGLSDPWSTLEGVPPSPSLEDDMPASKALETLLVCTCLAQSALSNNVNDDFVCDKVEKKSPSGHSQSQSTMILAPDETAEDPYKYKPGGK